MNRGLVDPASETVSGGGAWGSAGFRETGSSDDGGMGQQNA